MKELNLNLQFSETLGSFFLVIFENPPKGTITLKLLY